MYFTTVQRNACLALVPLVGSLLPVDKAHGQIIASEDAVGTRIENVSGHDFDIRGGQLSEDNTNLFHSFDQFDLTAEQTANFVTEAAVQNVIGRVNSDAASLIEGTLQVSGSDANLYLMNPAGVLLGPEAQLNLSGGFTATTATGIGFEAGGQFETTAQAQSNYQTLVGNPQTFHFDTSQAGAVVNLAELEVEPGEAIALIGGTVVNTGALEAPNGSITLAAVEGETLVRISQGNQLLSLEIEPATPNQTAPNQTALNQTVLNQTALNQTEISVPTSIGDMLTGSSLGHATTLVTHADGSVSLSHRGGTDSPIIESGGHAVTTGNLSTQGMLGGDINVLGSKQVQLNSATLDASGREGGGLIRIGGGYQGQDTVFNAAHTSVDAGSRLLASAYSRGDGGTVVVWADEHTQFSGRIVAMGGQLGGNGGFSEVSGKVRLDYRGDADLSATAGELGRLLLDPENWVITDGAAPESTLTTSYYSSSAIENATGLFDLSLTASDSFRVEPLSGNGTLKTSLGSSLTFSAGTGQFLMEDISNSIWAPGGTINISGEGIQVGHIRTDRSNGSAGNIRLISGLGVEATAISSNNYDTGVGAGNGGDITIEANGGDVRVGGEVRAWSYTGRANGLAGNTAGAGGNISIFAKDNIVLEDRIRTISYADGDAANTGGNISLIAETGSIVAQQISTESVAAGNDAARAGDITLSAENGNIQTTALTTFSRAGSDRAGDGGAVTITGQNVTVNGGISAYSRAAQRESGNGGSVDITANSVFIGPHSNGYSINASSSALANTQDGGDIRIDAQQSLQAPGELMTYAFSREGNNAGNGGAVTLLSNNMTTGDISSWAQANQWDTSYAGRGNAGNITVSETSNVPGTRIAIGSIDAESRAQVRGANNGGILNITADTIEVDSLTTSSIDIAGETNDAGDIFLTADTQAVVNGSITASSSNDASIFLVGDRIDLLGGANSIVGSEVHIRPATLSRPINVGQATPKDLNNPPTPSALNLWDSTLTAISSVGNQVTAGFIELEIGHEDVTGNIVLNENVTLADRVVLRSQGNIESAIVADGTPADIEAQGGVTLEAIAGQIQVGEIRTNNSDVNLNSTGSIEIELIDTRGNSQAAGANIDIETTTDFVALTQTADTGTSLATNSTQNDAISIRYGNPDRLANSFTIGSISNNGTTGSIETASSTLSTSPLLSGQTTVGNIQLTNRGRQPVVVPVEKPSVAPIEQPSTVPVERPFIDVNKVTATTSTASPESPSVPHSLTTVEEAAALESVLTQIEIGGSTNFAEQLGLSDQDEDQPLVTIRGMQDTLHEVENTTNSRPALVYVYFVPDAIVESSVSQQDRPSTRPDDQLEIMIVTAEGEPVRRRQWGITRSQIADANYTLRQQVTSQFSTAKQYLPPAQQLYNWIISPLEQTLQQRNINSIGFVMDTGLRMLPVAALHDGEQYLVENYSLGLLPTFSLTNFSNLSSQNAQAEANNPIAVSSEKQVLAMGASTFENQPDLPAVGVEINLITHQLWEGDAFLNEDFVLENLQQQLRQKDYGIVHLATHAVFEAGSLDNSYIQLWDEQLSLHELSESLHLSEAEIDLIILSACSTALGDEASEYGFAGFAVNAGSQAALASLWPVNDEGTLGFMSQFYQQLQTANIRSGALQQAQVSLIQGEVGIHNGTVYGPNTEVLATIPELAESGQWNFSHPSYWSAFTMIGNPW